MTTRIRRTSVMLLICMSVALFGQQPGKGSKTIFYPAKPINGGTTSPPMMQMPLVLPLFLEGNHFSSKLILINNSSTDTFADIMLRALDGHELASRRVQFAPHSQEQVSIGDLLQKRSSSATSGSIMIMQSSNLMGPAIAGALSMTFSGSGNPSYIDEEPSMLSSMGSKMLQGVVDRSNGSPTIAISSAEKTAQHVTIECLGEHGPIAAPRKVRLKPGETILANPCSTENDLMSVSDGDLFSQTEEASHGPVGIRLMSDGMPGSFAAFAVAPHVEKGDRFLSSVLFADPMEIASPNTVFAGIPVGPTTLLPEGAYTPHISLVNFSTTDIHASITFAQTSGDAPNAHEVEHLTVPARHSREVVLDKLQGDVGLQNSFIVKSNGAPGALMAKLVSKGSSSLHQVELQAKDEKDMNNAGNHPWSIEGNTESTLLLFNHSTRTQPFDLTVAGGGVSWQRTYKLAPMETKAISLRELVENQTKDERGKVLPKTTLSGELNWMVVDPNNGSGRLLQSDRSAGSARNFSCGWSGLLCGTQYNIYESVMATGDIDTFAELVPITCTGGTQNACTGQRTGTGGSFSYSWGSGTPSVASVHGSNNIQSVNLQGVSRGTSQITGQVHSQYCSAGGANPENVNNPPTYAIVQSDIQGSTFPNGDPIRLVTYKVYNQDGSAAASIPIGENYSVSGWNCTSGPNGGVQPNPPLTTSACNGATYTDSSGSFQDGWGWYTAYGSAGCGLNITDHWQWCSPSGPTPPVTFMTLTGYLHTNATQINGYALPPTDGMPAGTRIGP